MSRNSATISAGVKLGIFTLVSIFVTGLLVAIMGNIGFGAGKEYHAIFSSATQLEKGDDVRVAGVSVGEVKEVEHYERNFAKVTFRVKAEVPVTTSTQAKIRFLNLVGDRYMALLPGADPDAERLSEGDTIDVKNTEPSLDLTKLFNGFQPLFQALNPEQVNELSLNLVQVLQGEGGTIASLLEKTASLTNALADRDQLIGDVIDNLTGTVETVNSHQAQLNQLIVELRGWMGQLARDRKTIGSSLSNIADLTQVVAQLLHEGRAPLKADIAQLRKVAELLTRPEHRATIVRTLERLPESMTDQTRTGTYGSWYNYYLCAFSGRIQLPLIEGIPGINLLNKQLANLSFRSPAARCQL